MSAQSEVIYSVKEASKKDHSFVKGNTKFLKDMSQEELAILSGNGDPRVEVRSSDEKKQVRAAAPTPAV